MIVKRGTFLNGNRQGNKGGITNNLNLGLV